MARRQPLAGRIDLGRWVLIYRIFLLVCALSSVAPAVNANPDIWTLRSVEGDGPWVVRIATEDPRLIAKLRTTFDVWGLDRSERSVILAIDDQDELNALEDYGLPYQFDPEWTEQYFRTPLRAVAGSDTIPGFACYSTVEHTYQRLDTLAASRPDLAQIIDIGDSWEKINLSSGGYDIRVIRITNSAIAGPKPVLFAMGSIHAREYTPAELVTRFAERLINDYGVDPDVTWIVDHHEVHLLAPGNPDGRKRAEAGQSWRKTTNQAYCGVTSNSRGADMNRNFPFKWQNGGTGQECFENYTGPSPASESETQAINNYIATIFPDQRGPNDFDAAPDNATGVYLDIHSFSEVVIWPWGWNAPQLSPNNSQLQTLGRRFAFFNSYLPETADDFGGVRGASDDNAYGELGVATYTFELGTTFFQSCAVFENTILPDNMQALMYAARVARTPYLTPGGPDILTPQLSEQTVEPGDSVTLTATATDNRFNNSNGVEPTQAIASVNVTVNVPPWDPSATPISLSALDGNFDQLSEVVSITLDTTGFSNGRMQLYLQATDQSGASGPVSAVFLDIDGLKPLIFMDGFETP